MRQNSLLSVSSSSTVLFRHNRSLASQSVRAAITERHRLSGLLNNKDLFHTILETEKYKTKVSVDPGSSGNSPLDLQRDISLYPHMVKGRERES